MSSDTVTVRVARAKKIPAYRTIPWLLRNPLKGFEKLGARADGAVVRLNLGLFRPYLVTRPEHVQHVLIDGASHYVRDGMMWKPLRRLLGDGLITDGETWEPHRKLIQPLFSGKNVALLMERMAEAITEAVDSLEGQARAGEPVDACIEMTRIVHRAILRVFFGDKISPEDAEVLGNAIETSFTSLGARMLLPFIPNAFPMPGDRRFRRAVKRADKIIFPIVREARRQGADGGDVVSLLLSARHENGEGLTDQQVRDDILAMFVGGSETTAVALTWLWVVLDAHPDIATTLQDEIDRVVGQEQPGPSHLPELRYTKMVLQELLRLYPVGWIIPRTVQQRDSLDGVAIREGATVLLSPYLTHRMAELWERPLEFDPERFSAERTERRHRYAYFPFGGGAHQCLGGHFFMVEAQLVLASILQRYSPKLLERQPVEAQASASLRPRRRVELLLRPIGKESP